MKNVLLIQVSLLVAGILACNSEKPSIVKEEVTKQRVVKQKHQTEMVELGDNVVEIRKFMNWSEDYLSRYDGQWRKTRDEDLTEVENWPVGEMGLLTVVYDKQSNEIVSMKIDHSRYHQGQQVLKFNIKTGMVLQYGEISTDDKRTRKPPEGLPGLDL